MTYRVGMILLYVRDITKSKKFYTHILNAKVIPEISSESFICLVLADGPPIALFDAAKGVPAGISAEPGGFEIAIEVEDLDATYKDWQTKNVAGLTEIFTIGGGRQFYGQDPDGHCLAIYQFDSQMQEMIKKITQ